MKFDYKEIGRRLKEKRLSQRKEIKDIVADLKISEEYLLAIESGETENLPSMVYYNLFIRTYASELEIDPDNLLDETLIGENIKSDIESDNADESAEPAPEKTNNNYTSPAKIFGWIAAIIIIAFITVMVLSSVCEKPDESGITDNSKQQTNIESENPINNEIIEENTFRPDSIMGIVQEQDSTIEEVKPEQTTLPLRLDISVTELSWILILADDDTVLHRNLKTNAMRTLTAEESFNISIGNPNGVVLKLNDTLMRHLSRNGRPIMNMLITQDNKENYYLITRDTKAEDTTVEGN